MPEYADIYVRDSLRDTGVVPSTDNPWASPDIIPNQGDTLTPDQAASTYTDDIGKRIVNGGLNYFYVRAKNLSPTPESGTVSLHYSKASLLMTPSQWLDQPISTASGLTSVPFLDRSAQRLLAPGDIGLAQPAFMLTSLPATNDHYCFVAVVTTPRTTVEIPPAFGSNTQFAQWVMNTPAVAWRNVAMINNPRDNQVVASALFGNMDPSPRRVYFRVVGTDMPVGTDVHVQNADTRCPIDERVYLPVPEPDGKQINGFESDVPARYEGGVSMTITTPRNTPFGPGATIRLEYYQVPDQSNDIEASVATDHRVPEADGRAPAYRSLVELGRVTLRIGAAS
ncbi:hypothetical protein [Saccharothrix yanglingensis]|uniref:hypothetical protein n=1 Tax=Saccharothrix yanglingensis TaxID=659496 RepID=UPI0027D30EC8|nr:hypothetical protein [Saccharothrix yanglingensis]